MANHNMYDDLPDNSNIARKPRETSREPASERHAEKRAQGKPQKSLGRTLLRTFILEDPKDVAQEIWETNIVPGIREAADNTFRSFIYGIGGGPRRSSGKNNVYGRVVTEYDAVSRNRSGSNGGGNDNRNDVSRSRRSARDFDPIVFEDAGEAKDILQDLFDEAVDYGKVSVAFYYELSGLSNEMPYTGNDYGWYKDDIEGVKVERLVGGRGYVIDLPKPVHIK